MSRFVPALLILAFFAALVVFLPTSACPTEDTGRACIWVASVQGNGEGRSFLVDRFGNVHYLP